MRPPVIPPAGALAVDGRLPEAVAATLAEARRIRDHWSEAVATAERAAEARVAARLRLTVAALHRWAGRERDRLRDQALDLALALAERIARRALAGDPEATLAAAVEAAEALPAGPWLRIRAHPSHVSAWTDSPAPDGVEFLADERLRPGDLIVEGPAGRIDARVATRVAGLVGGRVPADPRPEHGK